MGAGYSDWCVYSQALVESSGQSDAYLYLNTDGAKVNSSSVFGSAPTSTVFHIGNNQLINNSGSLFVAYCWAEIPGYSSIGRYSGNGSTDGPCVYTGFRPAYVMVRRTDSANDWIIYDAKRDTYNVCYKKLLANGADAEYTDQFNHIDMVSNGFKPRTGTGGNNASGGTYIYIAFAEHPFGGSGVSPVTAR
jgi:hypothetical protein